MTREEFVTALLQHRGTYGQFYDQHVQPLVAEVGRLKAHLAEAADDIVHWGSYAGDYFQIKWDLEGDIARYRALAGEDQ